MELLAYITRWLQEVSKSLKNVIKINRKLSTSHFTKFNCYFYRLYFWCSIFPFWNKSIIKESYIVSSLIFTSTKRTQVILIIQNESTVVYTTVHLQTTCTYSSDMKLALNTSITGPTQDDRSLVTLIFWRYMMLSSNVFTEVCTVCQSPRHW